MKGFCAPLLALMMTGMVVGEQPQSSNSQTRQDSSANSNLLGKYLLVMTDEYVRSLKNAGYLSADISRDGRSSIDHVVFHGSDQNSRRTDLEPFSIQPLPLKQGDDRLQFLLSDQHLRMMNEHGLMYVIPENDRGRFSTVQVIYDPPQNAPSTTPVVQRPNAAQDQRQFDQASNRQRDFIGPQLPADWETRQNNYRNVDQNQFANNNESFRPRIEPIATRRDSTYSDSYSDRAAYDNRQAQSGNDFNQQPLAPINDSRLANRQNTFEPNRNGTTRNDQDFSSSDLARRNPADRDLGSMGANANWGNPINTNRRLNDNVTPRLDPIADPNDQLIQQQQRIRDAKARELAQLQQESRAQQDYELNEMLEQARLEKLQRQQDLLRGQRNERYASTADPLSDSLPTLKDYTPRRADHAYADDAFVDSRTTDFYQQVPRDRLAAAPRPTNKPPAFSIPAPNDQSDQALADGTVVKPLDQRIIGNTEFDRIHKQNAALWFIMLFSIGLNFYLSWISRGFYVRYEELADELRESFTNTMSS